MTGPIGSRPLRTAGESSEIPEGNVAELFLGAIDSFQKSDALRYKRDGRWHDISHGQLYEDVKRAAFGLEQLGIRPGDRVAILSENRTEWLVADFACVMSLAVSVPLYPVLPAEQIEYMLRDSEAKVIFVSNREQLEKVRALRSKVSSLENIVVFDDGVAVESDEIDLRGLLRLGERRLEDKADAAYRAAALAAGPHDLLTILYTSGTTGRPKGVMLTHNNLVSNVRSVLQAFDITAGDVSLSVLPLCHIFERMAGHYVMFTAGVTICYAESFATVGENFLEVRPTVMTMVPRGYEKIYSRVQEVARQGGAVKQKLLAWAIDVGSRHLDRKLAGSHTSPLLGLQYAVADRLVFSKIRRQTGGRVRYFVSGGAPLNPQIGYFFLSAGLTILEGYGLTETSPVIAFNTQTFNKLGTVGKPIAGVEVAIAEDGEILTRGPHVMKGYYKMPEATAAAIDASGWFHTGDIGGLDHENYLSITDRKKDLIVTAGGKNIAPQPIENRVQTNPYVNQAVMIGDRRRFAALLVVPDFDALTSWARSEGIEFESLESLVKDRRVIEFLEREVLGPLTELAQFERPKRIALLPRELSVEAGEMTPTLKVKRRVIEAKYKQVIDELYAEE
ncbi:MAG: long-chain fatty acid--CoA ligase [Gemmatimonadota bacterium]|nr:MAG: long-chain fatty acid--CoA ligase [Gemmatimonadota bacterium]